MKLIIDIPDYEYKKIREYYEKNDNVEYTYSHIYYGTPLPKGHGRLIDGDALKDQMKIGYKIVENAPTIIEADEGE